MPGPWRAVEVDVGSAQRPRLQSPAGLPAHLLIAGGDGEVAVCAGSGIAAQPRADSVGQGERIGDDWSRHRRMGG
jgi:hypothetical protein